MRLESPLYTSLGLYQNITHNFDKEKSITRDEDREKQHQLINIETVLAQKAKNGNCEENEESNIIVEDVGENVRENGDEEDILAFTTIPEKQLSFAGSDPVPYDE